MKKIIFLSMLVTLTQCGAAQSIHEVELKTGTFEVGSILLVSFADGSGFLKLKKQASVSSGATIEIPFQQVFPYADPDAPLDTLQYYKTTKQANSSFAPFSKEFIVCFSVSGEDQWNPLGIITDSVELLNIGNLNTGVQRKVERFSSARNIPVSNPDPVFFNQFFHPTDKFFVQLFKPNSKDLNPAQQSTELFLLIVANTNDKEIGVSAAKDMDSYLAYFKGLTDFLGIKFNPITISGPHYNKQNVLSAINNKLMPAAQDIVVFYYSGHGFRLPKDNRRYPYIDLRANNKQSYVQESLNMQSIYEMVVAKKARLNIVMSDCCNAFVESANARGAAIPVTKNLQQNWSYANCKELFLNPKPTSLFISSADADQKATSNDRLGGFFGYYFQAALNNYLSIFQKFPSWGLVLQSAKKQTNYKASRTYCSKPYVKENICNQLPIYQIK